MGISSLFILSIEAILFVLQLGHLLARPNDPTRYRFLALTSAFIVYNVLWYLLAINLNSLPAIYSNYVSFALGIGIGAYYYNYIRTELRVVFSLKNTSIRMIISGIGSVIMIIGLVYYIGESLEFSTAILISTLVGAILYLGTVSFITILRSSEAAEGNSTYRHFILVSYVGFSCLALVLVVQVFIGFNVPCLILANMSYFLISFSYFVFLSKQVKQENSVLQKTSPSKLSTIDSQLNALLNAEFRTLTHSQKLIAHYILCGLSHKEIADRLNLATNTVTKEASVIYMKTNCRSNKKRLEFIEKFGGYLKSPENE